AAESSLAAEPEAAPFIPLFIAINHEGDGYPYSEIRSGLTELPSPMAIGATFDETQAQAVGEIAGAELAALGVNLLLGPSLDVVEEPRPRAAGDPGVRAFGGDPYWVGQMGQAYIRGVHQGSRGRVGVVAKFFPGYGSSDRDPTEEIPTARKTLDQLRLVHLRPFLAVTANAPEAAARADGLMSAHIRYQGLQGNIGQTTRPVSLDPRALGELLAETKAWREGGGIVVSDSLGVRAIKRFFEAAGQTFNGPQVALEAFNAGNDLLYLSDFGLNPPQDQTAVIEATINRFVQAYEADRDFRLRVDSAVKRLLALKLRLYGGVFSPENVLRPEAGLATLHQGGERVREVAQRAATLISGPINAEPPGPRERIVFITDSQLGRQCSTCPVTVLLPRTRLQETVLRLYGPQGRGLTSIANLQSFGFEDLAAYLTPLPAVGSETPTPEPAPLAIALAQANWVVIAMLDDSPRSPYTGLVSRFLSERTDVLRNKKIVVFAFGAPYYLDTTDLSKITGLYALYSKAPEFVDVAARLLFRDLNPSGHPPISVESIGYDLLKVLAPDPGQLVDVQYACEPPGGAAPEATPAPATGTPPAEATPALACRLADTLVLRAGPIRDYNGNRVPDGTPIQLRVDYQANNLTSNWFISAQTQNGFARATLPLRQVGFYDISLSDPPANAPRIQLNVQPGGVDVTQIQPPTPTPTVTPTPTSAPPTPTLTVTPTPTPTPWGSRTSGALRVTGVDFFFMLLLLAGAFFVGYRLGNDRPQRGLRLALLGAFGVLAGYNFWAFGLPGADVLAASGFFAPLFAALLGALISLSAGWYWQVHRRG
ncbi:MAG: glycoside hydrolase family 3 N-terminal domain-containing protein, partial [Anaerolineales bacterium]|nr:glycoside hydrolase family 3 N-terminal domain-containing protein [Anaerolineales bacterium]